MRQVPDDTLQAIRGHFHALIRERAGDLIAEHGLALPELAALRITDGAKVWFPVPGMHGGFSYWLECDGEQARLVTESWSRVVEGSGQRHEVTAKGSRLLDEGFV